MAIAIAYAPATSANLGVGFDILGLALHKPGDIVRAELSDAPGVTICEIIGDGGKLPLAAAENTAGVAAMHVLKRADVQTGVTLTIEKQLPLGSGLGSSAASAVAAAVAVNAVIGSPLSREELLEPALAGEAVASGYHPDNVGPSLFGGITLFTEPSASGLTRLPVPSDLHLALVSPDVVVKTADARAALPASVPLVDVIRQTAAVAKLVDALYRGDVAAVGAAMECDGIIEPAREHLMPYFQELRQAAKTVGACALVISGAGPTLLAVCDSASVAEKAAAAMAAAYLERGIEATSQATQVNEAGAYIM